MSGTGNFIATAPNVTPITAEHSASQATYVPTGDLEVGFASGFDAGNRSGFSAGMFSGSQDSRDGGVEAGLLTGYARGFMAGRTTGLIDGAVVDTTPPTITVVSPTPGVAPGQPGGFPLNRADAIATPVVLRIDDLTPGVEYLCVAVTITEASGEAWEETIYRRGEFRGRHLKGSSLTQTGTQMTLTVYRTGGWLGKYLKFGVDAIDTVGNLA